MVSIRFRLRNRCQYRLQTNIQKHAGIRRHRCARLCFIYINLVWSVSCLTPRNDSGKIHTSTGDSHNFTHTDTDEFKERLKNQELPFIAKTHETDRQTDLCEEEIL